MGGGTKARTIYRIHPGQIIRRTGPSRASVRTGRTTRRRQDRCGNIRPNARLERSRPKETGSTIESVLEALSRSTFLSLVGVRNPGLQSSRRKVSRAIGKGSAFQQASCSSVARSRLGCVGCHSSRRFGSDATNTWSICKHQRRRRAKR